MIKSNLKQFLTYAVGSISQSALGFLLLPLYIRWLSPAEYGVITVLLTLNSVIGLVAGAGVLSGLSRLYYGQSVSERRAMAGTIISWMIATSLGLTLVIYIAAAPLSLLLFHTTTLVAETRVASFLVFLSALQASFNNIIRLEKHASGFVVVSLLGFLSDFLLKFYLIGWAGRGIEGYLISSVVSQVLMGVASIVVLRHDVSFALRPFMLREALFLGFPYIFSGLAMWILEISDRIILNVFVGPGAVGVYALANKFANVFNILLLSPISLFWTPFVFSYAVENGETAMRRILSQAFTVWMVIGTGLLVCISAGSADVIRLFARFSVYNDAALLIPFLSLAPFLYMMSHLAGAAILQSKQVRYSSYAMSIAAVVNIGLNLLLASRFSLYGVTAATVIGYIVLFSLMFYWAQHMFYVPYGWSRGFKVIGCGVAAIAAITFIKIDAPVSSFVVKEIVGMTVFVVSLRLVGGVQISNIQFVRDMAGRLFAGKV
jgi:O-antigen/teichoic acid export membrane protein